MRKLASIQRIIDIEPIEEADKLELAYVLGWQCVVNKGQFKAGQLAVYFEIDSFLPIRPEFEFLRKSSYKKSDLLGEGFKLKTIQLRGKLSQGLLLPISTFPELNGIHMEGTDVTEILNVKKWEIEERATTGGTVMGVLPYDVPHTDETRIQAKPELLNCFNGIEYYITTKMDGSSHSIGYDENGFHITGHNYEYKDDGKSSFYNYVNEHKIKDRILEFLKENEKLHMIKENVEKIKTLTIQGEFCAPGIQKNRLKLTKPEWYVFTVIINGKRIGLEEMNTVCSADHLNLTQVPLEEVGMNLPEKYPTVDALLERANGEYPNGGKKEGIIIRPTTPIYCDLIKTYLSMKVVSNQYLL